MAVEKGRLANPKLHIGICGEHGGDPASIEFCDKLGLDYVSCSPFRVPIARLAAAQASIKSMSVTEKKSTAGKKSSAGKTVKAAAKKDSVKKAAVKKTSAKKVSVKKTSAKKTGGKK